MGVIVTVIQAVYGLPAYTHNSAMMGCLSQAGGFLIVLSVVLSRMKCIAPLVNVALLVHC